jgi:hypothetical protein
VKPDLEQLGAELSRQLGSPPDGPARKSNAYAVAAQTLQRTARARVRLAAFVVAVAMGASGVTFWRAQRDVLEVSRDGAPFSGEVVEAATPTTLGFSEASRVELAASARARLLSRKRSDMHLVLERGHVQAEITPGGHWRFEAGAYLVRVIGTGLSIDLHDQGLRVEVQHGRVEVTGGVLADRAVPLSGGERLIIEGDRFTVEPIQRAALAPPPPPEAVKEPLPEPSAPVVVPAPEPRRSEPHTAPAPPPPAPPQETAGDWLARCDAARLQHDFEAAARACEGLRARFPATDEAAEAAFRLGRLAFEREQWDEAARWFNTVRAERPAHPLASDARGREMESLARAGHTTEAAERARKILAEDPDGAWAPRARSLAK